MSEIPVIKGMFVNSHIEALRKARGADSVYELERRYGKPVSFRNLQDVPVREEVRIIEIALDIMSGDSISDREKPFEAGRLHFRNFMETPFGRMIAITMPKTPEGLVSLLTRARHIARHVFKNTRFTSRVDGPKKLVITMENNDYPIDHFRGLFYEWMAHWNVSAHRVIAREPFRGVFEYTLTW